MGWCAGDALLTEAWENIRVNVEEEERHDLFVSLIQLFEEHDMDCYDGIMDFPEGEAALRQIHPDWNL